MSSPTRAHAQRQRGSSALDTHRGAEERYRQAADDALGQLDWCIGYLTGIRKPWIARALAKNRAVIRKNLLHRPEEPLPPPGANA